MTRRRSPKRRTAAITSLDFKTDHRALFRMAGDDWTPPAAIKVRHGVRSWTLTAQFTTADGGPVTLVTRLTRTKAGASIADERLVLTRVLRGKGGKP